MTKEQQQLLTVDLCSRLPYGVKGLNMSNTLCSLEAVRIKDSIWRPDKLLFIGQSYTNVKPLLFHLSSLTKEITISTFNDGKPFVPIDELKEQCRIIDGMTGNLEYIGKVNYAESFKYFNQTIAIMALPFWFFDLFSQWHVDYRGLIDQGLAIDVTTLKQNPYE